MPPAKLSELIRRVAEIEGRRDEEPASPEGRKLHEDLRDTTDEDADGQRQDGRLHARALPGDTTKPILIAGTPYNGEAVILPADSREVPF